MRQSRSPDFLILYTSFLAVWLSLSPASAQTCDRPVATVTSVQGTVEAKRQGEAQWQPVVLNNTYCPGDMLRVLERSRADVMLLDQSVLRLNANSTITLAELKDERTSVLSLLKGAAHFFSRGPRTLDVHTPFTIAGVRGTEFFISVTAEQTFLSIFSGTVVAANEAGSLTLTSGQSALAAAGQAPALRVVARPRDAVHWALYYPPVLYMRPATQASGSPWQARMHTSMAFYLKGDLQKAFDSIASVTEEVRAPLFFVYRASLLLAVGQVEEARADLQQAQRLDPNNSDALALRTMIAVTQNDPEQALQMAQQAVTTAPDSATAHIALSYARQARFDLEGARASLEKAVQLQPDNALGWARLAELHLSFGQLSQALTAAQRAVEVGPDLSRTQTVLGFAYLTRVHIPLARETFAKAITLDQADPLPRLGLGLAKIRANELAAGRQDLEVAASLDPNNALVRSYLGKAYFEEKQPKLDAREYGIARELDPRDPTPWFYGAIQKQTSNRPVEALHDLQTAIELNDNRAVYRSRLLLDADLAARSASLARIYSDLGFQPRALVEGWKALDADPSNFSAHRFLADSYAVLPRHEIARVSELLQSQLLQPLNLTPIQPRLAESNLFLISAGGPGALSFNEFNPLFNRDGVAFQVNGLGGDNDTWAGEGIVAGIYKKVSFSLGYTRFATDGFRRNNDQTDDIANAFVQLELSPSTSLQAEYRYRNVRNGDLELSFFPDEFRPIFTQEEETSSYRIGLRHAFAPGSTLLASLQYRNRDRREHNEPPQAEFESIDLDLNDEGGLSAEVQYLWRSRYFNLTGGIGYFNVQRQETLTTVLNLPPPPIGPGQITIEEVIDGDIDHTNVYAYSYIHLLKNVTFTLGFSADFFDTEDSATTSRDQFNPKFGITWNPFPGTIVRAAVFRVLKRTLIADQTLEPTQVAGFNQFFDDADATDAWRYGIGIDQKLSSDLYGGAEFSYRDLSVPFRVTTPDGPELRDLDFTEYLGRAYLLWTPHAWLALSAEYQYERFERDAVGLFTEVTTHRMPLGFRLFHPSGASGLLRLTYFNQDGEFLRRAVTVPEAGADDFWVVDAAVSYRLPKRYGLITIGATNLFDQRFKYQETDIDNPIVLPDRVFFVRATLALP